MPTHSTGSYDLNGDGDVDIFDVSIIARAYGSAELGYDLNGDGVVTEGDLFLVAREMNPNLEEQAKPKQDFAHIIGEQPYNFCTVMKETFNDTDWTFTTEGLGQRLVLRPYIVLSGNRVFLKNVEPLGLSAKSNIENLISRYKFGFNISVPVAVKTNIASFGWAVETSLEVMTKGMQLIVAYITVDFSDIAALGFTVKVNSTDVLVSGLAGKQLVFDPTVAFTTASVNSIDTCPLSKDTFVIAFMDDTAKDASYCGYYTNGTELFSIRDVDTNFGTVGYYNSISVSAFNETTFVIVWIDDASDDCSFAVCNTTSATPLYTDDLDANVGASQACSVSCLNSTHFVAAWMNLVAGCDCMWGVYDYTGSLITGVATIDNNAGGSTQACSVSAFNSTHFVVGWIDYDDEDATYAVYESSSTTAVNGPADIDTDVAGVTVACGVCVSTFNSTYWAVSWEDLESYSQDHAVYTSSGGTVISPSMIDSSSGALSYTSEVEALNSTYFALSWFDSNLGDRDLDYAIKTTSDATIVGLTDLETVDSSTYKYNSPCSKESATGIGIYDSCWIFAYVANTSAAVWRSFYPNGTEWDGVVPEEEEFSASITIVTTTHGWSILPCQANVSLDSPGVVSVTVTATASFDIRVKSWSATLTDGVNTISISNVMMHKETLADAIALTTDYQDVPGLTNVGEGTDVECTFCLWLTCPEGRPSGPYTYSISVQVVEADS